MNGLHYLYRSAFIFTRLILTAGMMLLSDEVFPAVNMKCISVAAGGEVTIIWNNTAAPAGFRSYHIYHSTTQTGPFTLIDSVNTYATQTYTHTGANANNFNAFYHVELNNTSGSTVAGDTIQAIRINVVNTGNGFASLLWNTSHTPVISTNSSFYRIYREHPAGNFTLIDSIDIRFVSPNYSDEIAICGDTVGYRIEVSDGSGCVSRSSIDGDFFQDVTPPAIPVIDTVSVDPTGFAQIGWNPDSSPDTYAYVLLENGNPFDTVIGISNTFYQTVFDATASSISFTIFAIDSCGNNTASSPEHQTLFLQGVIDPCTRSIRLDWNHYINGPSAPAYQVFVNENGSADLIAGLTTSNSFVVDSLVANNTYCFKVVAAVDGITVTSTSNIICVTPDLPIVPQFSYIRSISVFPNDVVAVVAFVDSLAHVAEYRLERGANMTGPFVSVQTIPSAGTSTITFTDQVSTNQVNYYRVASIDSCGNDAMPSQISRSVYVDTTTTNDFTNQLIFNTYEQWPAGVSHYEIYRSVDGIPDPLPVATITNGDTVFSDDVRDLYQSLGDFCYFVLAYEAPGNPFGFNDQVRSNEICTKQLAAVFIPNAFIPQGVNRTFNPAEAFISLEKYSLQIFSRFGELIFETTNPLVGWDGSYKGHHCEMGVYVYRFKALDEKGAAIDKLGSVTLLR